MGLGFGKDMLWYRQGKKEVWREKGGGICSWQQQWIAVSFNIRPVQEYLILSIHVWMLTSHLERRIRPVACMPFVAWQIRFHPQMRSIYRLDAVNPSNLLHGLCTPISLASRPMRLAAPLRVIDFVFVVDDSALVVGGCHLVGPDSRLVV